MMQMMMTTMMALIIQMIKHLFFILLLNLGVSPQLTDRVILISGPWLFDDDERLLDESL